LSLNPDDQALHHGVCAGERRAIAKAITLLESTRADHRVRADALLNALLPRTGRAMRLGISGVPGVGKSTFIESLGMNLIEHGHKVAVLAVDPSSGVSGARSSATRRGWSGFRSTTAPISGPVRPPAPSAASPRRPAKPSWCARPRASTS
jgi:hypothetical protein